MPSEIFKSGNCPTLSVST